jgi:hypothetical protein
MKIATDSAGSNANLLDRAGRHLGWNVEPIVRFASLDALNTFDLFEQILVRSCVLASHHRNALHFLPSSTRGRVQPSEQFPIVLPQMIS